MPPAAGRAPLVQAQLRLAAILSISLIGALLAWSLSEAGLNQSGMYFIGVPGLMAVLITLIPLPVGETRMSGTRQTAIAVLASAILIREGFICVLMAMPLVITVGGLVMMIRGLARMGRGRNVGREPGGPNSDGRSLQASMIAPLLLLIVGGLDGVAWQSTTAATGTERRVIAISEAALLDAVSGSALPSIDGALFQLPFPRPTGVTGPARAVGDQRMVTFTAGAMTLELDDIVLGTDNDHIRWTFEENTTPIGQWMDLHSVTLSWQESTDDSGLNVVMEIVFDRRLSPGLYFGPLQTWGADEMADVLVDMLEANITPVDRAGA